MDKIIDRTIKQYITSVSKEQPGLIAAYLFGSYARNNQRVESDIDIALVIDNLPDNERFNTQVRLMMLASKFDTRIEPHPISNDDMISGNPFAAEIKRTGIELEIQ
jgi:uncharacterized protein